MGSKRRRFKQVDTLEDRLSHFAEDLKTRAELARGSEREALLKKVRDAEHAVDLSRNLRLQN
ncbi:hypothetical protein [Bradyrhizobium stylosanthis]|uniref:hypothetical protein n=1 Tax=Bradyrhizobium stylosanthis TaxID=1803665 RepID=UPI000A3F9EB2|nr:hypothetical protein [Bradyrhizobium stylosanthis]